MHASAIAPSWHKDVLLVTGGWGTPAGASQAELAAVRLALAQRDALVSALRDETLQATAMRAAAVEKTAEADRWVGGSVKHLPAFSGIVL